MTAADVEQSKAKVPHMLTCQHHQAPKVWGFCCREPGDLSMRLHGMKQRDDAGFAIQLVIRTIMSSSPDKNKQDWMKAYQLLQEAQDILVRTGFYSDDFDPSLAAY